MNENSVMKFQTTVTVVALLLAAMQLGWEHLNGGIVEHHFLQSKDMPAMSNMWALVILPLMAWFSVHWAKPRLLDQPAGAKKKVFIAFATVLLASTLQSLAFLTGNPELTMYIALALFSSALFLPFYRSEYLLPHLVGNMLAFGPIIPFIGIVIMVTLSLIGLYVIRPIYFKLFSKRVS